MPGRSPEATPGPPNARRPMRSGMKRRTRPFRSPGQGSRRGHSRIRGRPGLPASAGDRARARQPSVTGGPDRDHGRRSERRGWLPPDPIATGVGHTREERTHMEAERDVQARPMPRIGDKAPAFKAVTTQGEINFPEDYSGQLGHPLQPPGGLHPGLHLGVHDLRHAGGAVRRSQLQAGRPLGRRPLQPHRLAAHHQGEDRVQGHEERRGEVPADRGHHHGGGQASTA